MCRLSAVCPALGVGYHGGRRTTVAAMVGVFFFTYVASAKLIACQVHHNPQTTQKPTTNPIKYLYIATQLGTTYIRTHEQNSYLCENKKQLSGHNLFLQM